MIDSSLQRLNMVESQVRPSDVTDRRILKAMLDVPREVFVPASLAAMAYMDDPVAVVAGSNGATRATRRLLAPRAFAKLVQLLEIGPDAIVLDVGCATGYSTAVLARLARRVVAVECDPELAAQAAQNLKRLGVETATVQERALAAGALAEGPFDAILLNGAVPAAPMTLLEQLKNGGRLAGVVAEGPAEGPVLCRAQVWQRAGKTFDARLAFEAGAAPLPGFDTPAGFVF